MQIRGGNLEYDDGNKKNKKATKIIITLIILIFVLMIAIVCTILYIKQTILKVYIDGVGVNLPQDAVIVEENTNKVYINIKQIAQYLDYESHNGEYKLYSEDTNKCWVYCKNETASFYLNSNKISKVVPDTTRDYEDYTIQDPVISKNGELYTSQEGISVGFNSKVNYEPKTKTLNIETLPYLIDYYTKTLKNYGYDGVSANFNNQKAILYNLFVVKKENNLYGVVDSKNNEIIGSRYKTMVFNENAKEFYVSDNSNKLGIVTDTGVTKINLLYDSINMIDKNNGLYVVKSNNKYGVLNKTGDIMIHLEYDDIGVDTTKFPADVINNKYVLYENLIPVYQNKKWGCFDVKGNIVIPIEFDYLGYTGASSGNASGKVVNNLLLIPNYKSIVLGKIKEEVNGNNKRNVNKYAVYNATGKELIPCSLDSAYSVVNAGVRTYYMEYKENTLDIEKYIQRVYKTSDEVEEETNKTNGQNNARNQVNGGNTLAQ